MLSFLSYQNFSPSHNFEQHRKLACTNHCMASKQSTKTTFSNSANLKQKETKMLTSVLIVGGKVRCKKWAKLKEIPNCLVTVRLMCFTNGHTIVFLPQTKRYYNMTHIADSVKVAIGIGIMHWQGIVWWSLKHIIVVCSICPNTHCQWIIAKSTFIELGIYVVVNFLSQVIFVFLLFLGMVMYANEVGTKV